MNFFFLGDSEGIGDFSRCSKLVVELSELSVVVTLSFLTVEGPEHLDSKSITSLTVSRFRSMD